MCCGSELGVGIGTRYVTGGVRSAAMLAFSSTDHQPYYVCDFADVMSCHSVADLDNFE